MSPATISADAVRQLRARTGAGIVDCKAALTEAGGEEERAVQILRERGQLKAARKADRVAAEGIIGVYVHTTKKVAAFVSLRCETDFVARTERFQELAKDLAMHVVAADPLAVSPEDIPADLRDEERSLLTQPFVKQPERTVTDVITERINELGERIVIEKFVRFTL